MSSTQDHSSTSVKMQQQNRMRNFPGLILLRVKKEVKTKKKKGENVHEVVEFLRKYNKTHRTWTMIKAFVEQDLSLGKTVLEHVLDFLDAKNETVFEEWLRSSPMKAENKVLLGENKKFFAERFWALYTETAKASIGQKATESTKKKIKMS